MPRSPTSLLWPAKGAWVIGVDEAGRGCLAGPVTAGAVCLRSPLTGLADSKALTPKRRAALFEPIQKASIWAVAHATAEEIDQVNILQATFLAMTRAIEGVLAQLPPDAHGEIWIDGNRLPRFERAGWHLQAYVGGDASHAPIAAASILAKETRDAWMISQADLYPQYGFDVHMSYGTPAHLQALEAHGPCPLHRQTFAPVRRAIERRLGTA